MEAADRRAMPTAQLAELVREAAHLGFSFSDTALNRFRVYIDTLLLWRSRLSLTTAATAHEIVLSHVLDSLPVCRFVEPGMRVADLGSGAGFPGIPLAIVRQAAQVSLVESRRKKANFLREVLRAAALANAEVIEERAEQLADHVSNPWDIVVSRAVWTLSDFLDVGERLLVPGGLAVAMKGPRATKEALAYNGRLVHTDTLEYDLPTGARHRLLIYRKP